MCHQLSHPLPHALSQELSHDLSHSHAKNAKIVQTFDSSASSRNQTTMRSAAKTVSSPSLEKGEADFLHCCFIYIVLWSLKMIQLKLEVCCVFNTRRMTSILRMSCSPFLCRCDFNLVPSWFAERWSKLFAQMQLLISIRWSKFQPCETIHFDYLWNGLHGKIVWQSRTLSWTSANS